MSVRIDGIFLQILSMSLTGSYCILAVLLMRLLLKKQPRIFSYALWLIVLFRLVCPVSFESPFSAFRMKSQQISTSQGVQTINYVGEMGFWWGESTSADKSSTTTDNKAAIQNAEHSGSPQDGGTIQNSQIVQSDGTTLNYGTDENTRNTGRLWNERLWMIAEIIWLAGAGSMIIYAVISAVFLQKKLKAAEKGEWYYELEGLETPFVFGIVSPKIYLPSGLSKSEICYILEHERTHIRRRDYLLKPIAFLVLCIHWFNPFVWLAFFCMGKDMEMSCDEAVLRKMGKEIKREYSTSLLNLSSGRHFLNGSPLAFGEGEVKSRVKNILSYKKPGFWGILLAVAVVILTGVVLISNPKASEKDTAGINKDTVTLSNSRNEDSADVENTKENSQKGEHNQGVSEDDRTVISEDKLPIYQKEQGEEVKALLASYGDLNSEEYHPSSASMKYGNDILIRDNKYEDISNLERWVTFYNHTASGEADAILLVQFTVEGDAILSYLSYEDGTYYQMIDNTRDKMGSQTYLSAQFPYLKEYQEKGFIQYYLTEEESLSREQISLYLLSSAASVEGIDLFLEFPYAALESYLGTEAVEKMEAKDLEACITKAVLNENQSRYHMAEFHSEAHYNLQIEENGNKTTV